MNRNAKRPGRLLWYALLACGLLVGLFGVALMLRHGHEEAFNVTREIPWGLLISSYEFFMAASAGLVLIANLGYVLGREEFKILGRRALVLALLAMAAAFAVMAAEITHPLRMALYALLSPNPASPLIWVGLCYGVYGLLLILQLGALLRGRERAASTLGAFGIVAAVAVLTVMGAILGVAKARPFWYGSFLPLYFAVSGLVSAGALLSVFAGVGDRLDGASGRSERSLPALGRFQAGAVALLAVMVIWKLVPGLYGAPPGKYEATLALLTGPLAVNFWVFEVGLGLALPLGLLLRRSSPTPVRVVAAGASAALGVFAMRYDLVVAGQLVPMREKAEGVAGSLLHYSPSGIEVAIVVGAVSAGLILYALAEKLLPLAGET